MKDVLYIPHNNTANLTDFEIIKRRENMPVFALHLTTSRGFTNTAEDFRCLLFSIIIKQKKSLGKFYNFFRGNHREEQIWTKLIFANNHSGEDNLIWFMKLCRSIKRRIKCRENIGMKSPWSKLRHKCTLMPTLGKIICMGAVNLQELNRNIK
jgi:hypothetical protein